MCDRERPKICSKRNMLLVRERLPSKDRNLVDKQRISDGLHLSHAEGVTNINAGDLVAGIQAQRIIWRERNGLAKNTDLRATKLGERGHSQNTFRDVALQARSRPG